MSEAGTYSPLDAPHMRDNKGRPLEWLNIIRCHRDKCERVVRSIAGDSPYKFGPKPNTEFTTDQLLGDNLLRRAHKHLIGYASRHMWTDPIV